MIDEKICRVCLNYDRGTCTGIFNKSNEIFIYEKLNLIANINIKPKDGLPDKICYDCLSELENAIIFKQKCETSNNILISALHSNIGLPKQEDEILEMPVKEEYDEYTDDGHFEEEPSSPPELKESIKQPLQSIPHELTLKPGLEEQDQTLSQPETHLEPLSKPNKAIDLQLECHDCGALFKSKCKLRVHWFKVHLKAQLTCNICGNTFGSFENLKEHRINRTERCVTLGQVRVEGEGKYRVYHCKECLYSTKKIGTMTKHLAVHSREKLTSHKLTVKPQEVDKQEHPSKPPVTHFELPSRPSRAIDLQLECHDCGALFKSKCKLKVHWFKTHLKAQLTCNICGNTFGSFENLKDHQINRTKRCTTLGQVRVEGEGKSRVYHCKACIYSTKYIETMTKHLAVHSGERGYACTLCPATYIYLNSFDAHMESKHGVLRKTIVCNICGETLGHRSFYSHMRKHKGDAAKCNICNKVFKYKSYMKIHMERHAGVKKYACDKCGKLFTTANSLYNHRPVHEHKQDSIYNCDLCEFKISDRKKMYKHKLNHSKYHYVCTKCGKFFENATQLSCHIEKHNDNYSCQHCEKTFFTRKILVRHMSKVHRISAKTGNQIVEPK